MTYYFAKTVTGTDIASLEARLKDALKEQGFGVLTEIDVSAVLKEKIGAEFRPYRILGACNPHLAHKALQSEDKIGTMLPCNVIVQQHEDGSIEAAAVDPVASMQAVDNPLLAEIAQDVAARLKTVIDTL